MAMLNFRVVHVGINNDSEEEAEQEVSRLSSLFGFRKDVKSASTFASEGIEVCRNRFPGAHGHIAIGTSSCERAMYFLSKCGVEFDIETAKYKGGRLTSVYQKEQVGGLAILQVEKKRRRNEKKRYCGQYASVGHKKDVCTCVGI